jgi:HlyD family secretion protein
MPAGLFRWLVLFLVFVGGLVLGAASLPLWENYLDKSSQAQETTAIDRPEVGARGRLEPAGGIINVGPPGPDRLREIKVKEGDRVVKDQPLAILDSYELREIEVTLAKKQKQEADQRLARTKKHLQLKRAEAKARFQQLQKQTDLDIQGQKAKIGVLEQQLSLAKDLYQRMDQAGTSYTQQERDNQQLAIRQATGELQGARALLEKADYTFQTNPAIFDIQDKEAEAALERAESEIPQAALDDGIRLSELKLDRAILRAPVQGTILKSLGRPGELVGTQAVFQMGDTNSMVVVAEVYQTDVDAVRRWVDTGRPVRGRMDLNFAEGKKRTFWGTVQRVGQTVLRNSILSLDPRQDVDRRVVEVRILLDDTYAPEAALFIGMDGDVTIRDPKESSQ